VQNYTLGNALYSCNLVSFTYTSSVLNYSVVPPGSFSLSGTLPASLPATAAVTVSSVSTPLFNSNVSGSWTVGYADDGTSSIWSSGSGPSAAPAPSTALLGALGLLLAGAGGLLAQRRARGAAGA
jgi:hypothetical protein